MTEIINQNLFSPNKFLVTIPLFPTVQFFVQDAQIPGFTIGKVKMNTNKNITFNDTGDRITFEDLNLQFILDEDMVTFKELYTWTMNATAKNRSNFNPFQDMTVTALSNNSNKNFSIIYKHCSPYALSRVDMSTKKSEDSPIILSVDFVYSEYVFK